jgi:hypothetical protein
MLPLKGECSANDEWIQNRDYEVQNRFGLRISSVIHLPGIGAELEDRDVHRQVAARISLERNQAAHPQIRNYAASLLGAGARGIGQQ